MYYCQICKTTFNYERQFKYHQLICHNKLSTFKCQCGKKYLHNKDLTRHKKKCSARSTYLCSKCGTIFSDFHNGRLHETVCDVEVKNTQLGEPTKNYLLSLKPGINNISPYETSFDGRLASYFIRSSQCMDLPSFLSDVRGKLEEIISNKVAEHLSIKVNLWVDCTFINMAGEEMNKALKTSNQPIYEASDIEDYMDRAFSKLNQELDQASMSKSGWSLVSVDGIRVRIGKYNPLKVSTYIKLPKSIDDKKACINVQNYDNKCFFYAILSKFVQSNAHRPQKYKFVEHKYNFSCVEFPVKLKDVSVFERVNNISINIFGLDEKNSVYPIKIVDKELDDHRDLLLLSDYSNHYVYIKNFNRLINAQVFPNSYRNFICKRCFTHFDKRFDGHERFINHKQICGMYKPARVDLPYEKPYVHFEHVERRMRVPVVIYLDFEVILEKIDTCQPSPDLSHTSVTHIHTPMSFCLYVKTSDELDGIENGLPEIYLYRGSDAAKHCVLKLKSIAEQVEEIYSLNNPIKFLTTQQEEEFIQASNCYLCDKPFSLSDYKVKDHSHITGSFLGAAHNSCNLRRKSLRFIPIFCHNLSGYDSHIIVKELGYDEKTIEVIPNSEEKYISFSKIISNRMKLRFVDTFRFMSSSLDSLAKNLTHFPESSKFIPQHLISLVKRKGVYPYEYVSSWDKLNETSLPPIEAFYSTLTGECITDDEYQHAHSVWTAFSCHNIGDFSDIYLRTDCLLLADIFENFRTVTITSHKLDPAYYFTLPGLSWDAMLRHTGCRLELLTDFDQILMIEKGIRGGICQVSHRYAEANNKYTADYNPSLESTFIKYEDANNLYGWAMSKFLPYGGFRWVNPENVDIESLNETGEVGYILDVDIEYPDYLHNTHNDLPFLAENIIIDGQCKLVPHLGPRQNYICHFMILKQAIEHGLKLLKINRALEFKQSPWLASYIELNNNLRKQASNDFEKDLYKLYNNSVFGKTMENVRKRISIKLVSDKLKLEKMIARPNCVNWTNYSDSLAGVHFQKSHILFNKPIYVGLSVLDLSKFHMYYYHYDVNLKYYGNRLKLCYMDTDSFVYLVKTDDIYADMKEMPFHLDLSNYPSNHKCYSVVNKKVLGKFKDETAGVIISAFVGLRSKMYAIKLNNENILKKAKGVKKNVLKKIISFDDYVACLITNSHIRHNMTMFRSKQHQLLTIVQNKVSLCPLDNKRHILEDNISTKALNHCAL